MSQVDICADIFGTGPGLAVVICHTEAGLLLQASLNGVVFESYAPRNIETALAAAGYLIRGSQPPRDLFLCRDTPVR